eukprot:gene16832-7276_t
MLLLRRIAFRRLGLPHWLPHDPGRPLVVVLGERRPGPKSRMPANWEAAKGALRDHFGGGVELASPLDDGAGVAAQLRAFNRADAAVGPHGANIANFMSYRYGNQCYYMTAQRLGISFRFVLHSTEDKKGAPYD